MLTDQQFNTEILPILTSRTLLNVCLRYVKHIEDAEDLAQQVAFRAWRSRETFNHDSNATAWVMTIARNLVSNHFNDQKRERVRSRTLANDPTQFSRVTTTDPCADLDLQSEVQDMNDAINDLSPARGELIRLRFIDGHSADEAAKEMGIAYGTALSGTYRAIRELRRTA